MLSDIRNCILATDLALFFGNKAKLKDIADKEELSWHEEEHRYDVILSLTNLPTFNERLLDHSTV